MRMTRSCLRRGRKADQALQDLTGAVLADDLVVVADEQQHVRLLDGRQVELDVDEHRVDREDRVDAPRSRDVPLLRAGGVDHGQRRAEREPRCDDGLAVVSDRVEPGLEALREIEGRQDERVVEPGLVAGEEHDAPVLEEVIHPAQVPCERQVRPVAVQVDDDAPRLAARRAEHPHLLGARPVRRGRAPFRLDHRAARLRRRRNVVVAAIAPRPHERDGNRSDGHADQEGAGRDQPPASGGSPSTWPPSTWITLPVVHAVSGSTSVQTQTAISSETAIRPSGMRRERSA